MDFNIRPGKIEVIPHGVDSFKTPKDKATKTVDSPISLLYVGVLTKKKCIHYIIEALGELKKRGRRAHLTVLGEGDHDYELKKLANTLNLEDSISWCQPLFGEELHRMYAEADIFLLLSRDESYGLVVAEALAAGTPCVVTETTALKEFLTEPGCFGVSYPPDASEVADLVVKIHNSTIQVGPFSHKIRTWDKVAIDYETLYERVIRLGRN